MKKSFISIITLFFVIIGIQVFSQSPDSIQTLIKWKHKKLLKRSIGPTLLIGYGISIIDDNGLFYSSHDAYYDIQKKLSGFHTNTDDYLMFAPAATVFGLNAVGIKGKNSMLDASLIYLLACSFRSITTLGTKGITQKLRPDSSDYMSFPSGHTSFAFVSATFLFEEYRSKSIWIGVAGYSMAITTGALRMLNNRHWMSDVFVGAGFGILSTELAYYTYPWIKSKIFKNKKKNFVIVPNFGNKQYGISIAAIL